MPTLRILHALDSHVDVLWGDVRLARYVHRPDMPQLESPKPYLHPVRTLDGDLVTAYRPHDHVWHKGIQLALPHVGHGESRGGLRPPGPPANFWGGVTWVRGEGYKQLDNNGSMDHVEFEALEADGDRARITERLQWRTQAGEHVIDERRALTFAVLDGAWVLSFDTELTNRSGGDLVFGSPTTNGRPNAGYGGLLWRGPREFSGGEVLLPGGPVPEEEAMGASSPWVAFVGTHDETLRKTTLAFYANGPEPPWFVRSGVYAVTGPAPWFHAEQTLADGEALELSCDIAIADGAWTAGEVEAFRAGVAA